MAGKQWNENVHHDNTCWWSLKDNRGHLMLLLSQLYQLCHPERAIMWIVATAIITTTRPLSFPFGVWEWLLMAYLLWLPCFSTFHIHVFHQRCNLYFLQKPEKNLIYGGWTSSVGVTDSCRNSCVEYMERKITANLVSRIHLICLIIHVQHVLQSEPQNYVYIVMKQKEIRLLDVLWKIYTFCLWKASKLYQY